MHLEIELKFPNPSGRDLRADLVALGASFTDPIAQADHYWNHPSRDFAATGEAMRLRTEGDELLITYKGPKLDRTTKTRREIELPLGLVQEHQASWSELLATLGFRSVATVAKTRTPGELFWEGWPIQLALDEVAAVGSYIELETLVAENADAEGAKQSLWSLAMRLGLSEVEPRSYLRLLLERNG